MVSDISLLYIGSLNEHSNSFRRFATLRSLCRHVDGIDTDGFLHMKFVAGFQHHFNAGPGVYLLNHHVGNAIKTKRYDVILVDNKPYLNKKTLRRTRRLQPDAKIVNLLTDDPNGKFRRSWSLIRRTAPLYDHHFVQRLVNIDELKGWGARRVGVCFRSFDPAFHKPVQLTADQLEDFGAPVGFIGTYEEVRAGYIAYLIENGIPVKVIGDGWEGASHWEIIRPHYKGPSVYGEDYIKHINGMEIALHFLRHANRDEQDSRTFELPACGTFMIAERSRLHEQLFEEDLEAVFFETKEELMEKVRYYQERRELRDQIALNGYNACHSKGYDHRSRLQTVINEILG